MTILDRLFAHIDTAIEAVIGAVIDVICREWIEETAQAAKEEGRESLCENPTKANEQ